MKIFNFFIYFLTLFIFFLIFTIFFDLIKNKMIFKKEEKCKSLSYEFSDSSNNDSNIKIEMRFLKLIILFLILNTGIVYLLPWA
ncbi:NADH-quinone oxidoreductase subunit A, partial [Escherichia coli]|uniref:NADH-quinone oxidoreductase subunit A n=1 Tax=Escherichia coli TaxID=562 RepID=UPI00128F3961